MSIKSKDTFIDELSDLVYSLGLTMKDVRTWLNEKVFLKTGERVSVDLVKLSSNDRSKLINAIKNGEIKPSSVYSEEESESSLLSGMEDCKILWVAINSLLREQKVTENCLELWINTKVGSHTISYHDLLQIIGHIRTGRVKLKCFLHSVGLNIADVVSEYSSKLNRIYGSSSRLTENNLTPDHVKDITIMIKACSEFNPPHPNEWNPNGWEEDNTVLISDFELFYQVSSFGVTRESVQKWVNAYEGMNVDLSAACPLYLARIASYIVANLIKEGV